LPKETVVYTSASTILGLSTASSESNSCISFLALLDTNTPLLLPSTYTVCPFKPSFQPSIYISDTSCSVTVEGKFIVELMALLVNRCSTDCILLRFCQSISLAVEPYQGECSKYF